MVLIDAGACKPTFAVVRIHPRTIVIFDEEAEFPDLGSALALSSFEPVSVGYVDRVTLPVTLQARNKPKNPFVAPRARPPRVIGAHSAKCRCCGGRRR